MWYTAHWQLNLPDQMRYVKCWSTWQFLRKTSQDTQILTNHLKVFWLLYKILCNSLVSTVDLHTISMQRWWWWWWWRQSETTDMTRTCPTTGSTCRSSSSKLPPCRGLSFRRARSRECDLDRRFPRSRDFDLRCRSRDLDLRLRSRDLDLRSRRSRERDLLCDLDLRWLKPENKVTQTLSNTDYH